MITKLDDIHIFSDIDKTLYTKDDGVPKRNINAIKRFTQKGGKFAVATGRSLKVAQPIIDMLPVNIPCILCNGGAIYDTNKKMYLYQKYLPKYALEYAKQILIKYPYIGMAAITDSGYYYIGNSANRLKRFHASVVFNNDTFDSINENIYKVLLTVPDEECKAILYDLQNKEYDGVNFSSSDSFYIDMLPKDVSKATALDKICDILNVSIDNIITVGDYYNDFEMLSKTPISACVKGSPKEIEAICSIKLCDFKSGAIGDLIEKLENFFERA